MWFFKKKNVQRIVITFTTDENGGKIDIHMDKGIHAVRALTAIDRVKGNISRSLSKRVEDAKFAKRDPKKIRFIRSQTLGDII